MAASVVGGLFYLRRKEESGFPEAVWVRTQLSRAYGPARLTPDSSDLPFTVEPSMESWEILLVPAGEAPLRGDRTPTYRVYVRTAEVLQREEVWWARCVRKSVAE